jgi:hypothetical protein
MALPVVAVTPSYAAVPPCGTPKTARVSIHYKACVEKIATQNYIGHFYYGNDHGSAVGISTQYGWKVNSHTDWISASPTLRAAPGYVERESEGLTCEKGQTVTAVVRVKQNNGDWGPTAYSLSYTCS